MTRLIGLFLLFLAPGLRAQTAYTGLGGSTANCVDRDGDGYCTGPAVIINTTVASTISSGTQTVTPASMTIGTTTATTYNSTATVSVSVAGLVTRTGGASSFTDVNGNPTIAANSYIVIPAAGCGTVAGIANACQVSSVTNGNSLNLVAGTYTATSGQTATWATAYLNLTSIASEQNGEEIAASGLLKSGTTVVTTVTASNLSNTAKDILVSPAPLLPFSGQTVTFRIGVNMRLRVYQLDANNNLRWPGSTEYVQVSSTASTTFTANFFFTHDIANGTIHITDLRSLGPDADDLDATVHTGQQLISKYTAGATFPASNAAVLAAMKALYTPSKGYTTATHADYAAYNPAHIWYLAPTAGTSACITNNGGANGCSGNDVTGAVNDPAHPFATWAGLVSHLVTGDMIVLRDGFNDRISSVPAGSSGAPTIIKDYPGERPAFDSSVSPTAACGPGVAACGIFIPANQHIVVDGVRFQNGGTLDLGDDSNFLASHDFHDIILRHIDAGGDPSGPNNQACWVQQMSGFTNLIIEDTACHDSGEHGEYIGCTFTPCTGLVIQRNVLFNNGWSGFGGAAIHLNGIIPNSVLKQNYVIGSSIDAFDLQSGISGATITSNVAVSTTPNNDTIALILDNYKDGNDCNGGIGSIGTTQCQVNSATWASGTATLAFSNPGTGVDYFVGGYVYVFGVNPSGYNCLGNGCVITAVDRSVPGNPKISYAVAANPGTYVSGGVAGMGSGDATGNTIENNTFISTYATFPAVRVVNSCQSNTSYCPAGSVIAAGSLDNQIFRNNIFISNGAALPGGADNTNFPHMPVVYDNSLSASSNYVGVNYLPTATFDHNLFFDINDPGAAHSWAIGQSNTCGSTTSTYVTYSVTGGHQYAGCTDLMFTTGGLTGNIWGDPKMITLQSSMLSGYVFSEAFDMRLFNNSPAFGGGSATSLPSYDVFGRSYIGGGHPSIGGIERKLYKYGVNDLGVQLNSSIAPINGAPGGGTCGDGTTSCGCEAGGNHWTSTSLYPFKTYFGMAITDWGGGALRNRPQFESILFRGGGHGDYCGNEDYLLSFNLLTPTLTLLRGPSTVSDADCGYLNGVLTPCPNGNGQAATADNNPESRHQYKNLNYSPANNPLGSTNSDAIWMYGGGVVGGGNLKDQWQFSFSSTKWSNISLGISPSNNGPGPEGLFDYDPNTGYIIGGIENSVLQAYNPTNQTLTSSTNGAPSWLLEGTSIIDSLRRVWWTFGNTNDNPSSTFCTDSISIAGVPSSFPAFGACQTVDATSNTWANTQSPAVAFDPVHDRIVALPGLLNYVAQWNNTLYLADPGNNLVTSSVALPGATIGSAATNGWYGRFQAVPSMAGFVAIPAPNVDAVFISPEPSDPGQCSISPASLPAATVGQAYSQTLSALGCNASSWAGWTSCQGISLNSSTGVLSGTVTGGAGTCSGTVTYDTASQNESITINAAPAVTTSCPLPSGTQGVAYTSGSGILTNSGGTSPFTWSISTGALPTGLSISGNSIVGTPSVGGTSTFTLRVTDTNGIFADSGSCSLTISGTIVSVGKVHGGHRVKGGSQVH